MLLSVWIVSRRRLYVRIHITSPQENLKTVPLSRLILNLTHLWLENLQMNDAPLRHGHIPNDILIPAVLAWEVGGGDLGGGEAVKGQGSGGGAL